MAEHGPEATRAAERYSGIGQNLEKCTELEYYAGRWALDDNRLARFRPNVYTCSYDAEKGRMHLVSEFIDKQSYVAGGELDPSDWTEERSLTALGELAKCNSLFLNNYDHILEAFEGNLDTHPRRHLQALPLYHEWYKINLKRYPDAFNSERKSIVETYFKRLEEITTEEELYPLTFVHNDPHIGKYIRNRSERPISFNETKRSPNLYIGV